MQKLGADLHDHAGRREPPVAMLYSLSQAIHTQTKDMQELRPRDAARQNLPLIYLAGKLIQQQFLAVVEEDVLDGTLAADHKAIILTSLDYLDPLLLCGLAPATTTYCFRHRESSGAHAKGSTHVRQTAGTHVTDLDAQPHQARCLSSAASAPRCCSIRRASRAAGSCADVSPNVPASSKSIR